MAEEPKPLFLLYALERGLFWARPGVGYTRSLYQATRYSESGAQKISADSMVGWTPAIGYVSAPDIVVPEALTRTPEWVDDKAGVLQQLVNEQLPSWPFSVAAAMQLAQDILMIKCPRCEMVSLHPEDAKEGFCGNCHDWTSVPAVGGVKGPDDGRD